MGGVLVIFYRLAVMLLVTLMKILRFDFCNWTWPNFVYNRFEKKIDKIKKGGRSPIPDTGN